MGAKGKLYWLTGGLVELRCRAWIAEFFVFYNLRSETGAYRSTTTALATRTHLRGRVPITRRLARRLAGYALIVWGEAMLARLPDSAPKTDPMSGEQKTLPRQDDGIPTLTMYTRCGAQEFRPGDDPPEAAFYVLQVERLLLESDQVYAPLKLDREHWRMVDVIEGRAGLAVVASELNLPVSILALRIAALRKEIMAHEAFCLSLREREGNPVRQYCWHRFVRGRAAQGFKQGLALDTSIRNKLADQLTEVWEASIPQSVLAEMEEAFAERERERARLGMKQSRSNAA